MDKDKALGIKKLIMGIRFLMDRVYRVRNCVNKNKALGVKKPIVSKGVVRKCPFGFNPSGYL